MLPTPGKIAFHPINGQNVRVKTPDAMKPPQCHMPEWRNLPQSSAAQRENHRTSMTPLPETAIPIHLLLRRGECEQTRLDNPLKRRLSALEHSDCKHQRLQEDCSPSLPPAARGSCSDFQPGCSIPGSSLASASLLTSRADTLNLPMQNFSAQTTEDKLSQQVLQLYNQCQLFYSHWQVREGLRESLQHEICQVFPYSLLYLVGSSINGFGSDTSDGDLCLVLKHRMVKQRMEVLSTLQQVIKILHKLPFIGKQHLIRAKVPIVRFVDKQSQVEFDLNVNNIVGIRNTFLLQAYSRADPRVKPFVMVVKKWATRRDINNASQGTLSSYSLVLMAIYYLQVLQNPVVPCLQKEHPELLNSQLEIGKIPRCSRNVPSFISKNTMSLAQLLEGFFDHFSTFSWAEKIISIREGKTLCRTLDNEWWNKFICIEEPFDRTNTARAVHEHWKFEVIKAEFLRASKLMAMKLHIDFILNPVK
uniref:poly(A) RNA polymerase GLD2 isoform X1 n=1 Tax=Myxine glutinosa TaxID=7769 RepID=UPI00358E6329